MQRFRFFGAGLFIAAAGLYPLVYLFLEPATGLLSTKPDHLLQAWWWRALFYAHISFGSIAMLTGGWQFVRSLRKNRPRLHRLLGYVYTGAVLFSGIAAILLSFHATGGLPAALGFFLLGALWLFTTIKAVGSARALEFQMHEKAMRLSYACTLAALTLRIELPLLIILTGDFFIAYPIVAWLCWVPNVAVAVWKNRN